MSDIYDNAKSLTEQLELFGLTSSEAKLYLYLVGKRPQSVLEVAEALTLPRTSIYDSSVKLIEKGLIERIVTDRSQKLKAYPVSILQAYIDHEKARVESLQTQLTELNKQLADTSHQPAKTEVRYYHGVRGMQQMMWNSLRAKHETLGYSQFGRVDVVGKAFADKHMRAMIDRKIKDRVITNTKPETLAYVKQNPHSEERKLFQETRIIDSERFYVTGDTTIYNDIFAVAYWKQGEIVGVEIENAELVKAQKSIFEMLWNGAGSIEA